MYKALSYLSISLLITLVIVFVYNSITKVQVISDLSGIWKTCAKKIHSSECDTQDVKFPGQLPAEIEKVFSGDATLSRMFSAPVECLTGEKACSILINELGDAGKIYINGSLLGTRGYQGNVPKYEKHYPVQIDLPPKILSENNSIRIDLHSNKFMQTGLTKPPLGIVETSEARNFLKSKVFYNVFLPLFSAAILLVLLFTFLAFPLGQIKKSKQFLYANVYCVSSALFLFSFSEIPREYITMQIASPLHFFLRYASDFSLFTLLLSFVESKNFVRNRFFIYYYAAGILPFLLLTFVGLVKSLYPDFIDTSFLTYKMTQYSWPMKILPFLPLFFILKQSHNTQKQNKAANALLLLSCIVFVFQCNDILLFFGLIKSIYFIKFYPVFICFMVMGHLVLQARSLQELSRLSISRQEAIFRTTQMLAHDVKTPFAKLHAVINMFKQSRSNDNALAIISDKLPEIEDSLTKVENLIADIMSYSFSAKLVFSRIEPKNLFSIVIQQLHETMDCSNVEITSTILTNELFLGDQSKLNRVLFNICKNAVEAINGKGTIELKIKEESSSSLLIIVSNTGPIIQESNIPKIFDSFWTYSKKNGTGLGLSIAKNFVESHGGTIWCESNLKSGVKFFVSLPKNIGQKIDPVSEFKILKTNQNKNNLMNILIVDDEVIFQESLKKLFLEHDISGQLNIAIASDFNSAVIACNENSPDFVVLDLDLGPLSKNGDELLTYIRNQIPRAFVCLHSSLPYQESLIGPTPDVIVPKPMTLKLLSGLMIQAEGKNDHMTPNRPVVAILDDEQMYLTAWQAQMTDADLICFTDHEKFWDEVIDKPEVIGSLSAIILDHFLPGTNTDKLKLVRSIRKRGFKGPILLSTNAPHQNDMPEAIDRFDAVVGKNPFLFAQIKKLLPVKKPYNKNEIRS